MEENLYVLVNPINYEPIVICKVNVIGDYSDTLARFIITEVIYDNSEDGIYRHYHKIGIKLLGAKQYIHDIK